MRKNVSETNGVGPNVVGMLPTETFREPSASLADDFKVMDNPDSHQFIAVE
jgi:hypothetical protein